MKRPLFCVAMAYALGEVICFCTKTSGKTGIAIAVLVFVCTYFSVRTKRWKCTWILAAFLLLGVWRAFFSLPPVQVQGQKIYEEDRYEIRTYTQQSAYEKAGIKQIMQGMIAWKEQDAWIVRITGVTDRNVKPKYVLVRAPENSAGIGDVIQIIGTYQTFNYAHNPGGFHSYIYYAAREIEGYFYAPQIEKTPNQIVTGVFCLMQRYYRYKGGLYQVRTKLEACLYDILPEEHAAVMTGILLGDKTQIQPETKKRYQLGGIAHILAISGLHISMIGSGVFFILRKTGMPFLGSGMISILFMWNYGVLTGMSLATMRAVLMLTIYLVSQIFGKSYDMTTSMGIAMTIMLVQNPIRILDSGMQLSYMAIAGVLLGNYIMRRMHRNIRFRRFEKKHRIWFRMISSVVYSAVLNIMMFPVMARAYFVVATYAWIINLLVIPLMSVVVLCGWAGIIIHILSPYLAGVVVYPVVWILRGYEWLCVWSLRLPGHAVTAGMVSLAQIVLWYCGVIVVVYALRAACRNRIRDWVYKKTGRFWRKKQMLVYNVCVILLVGLLELGIQAGYMYKTRTEIVCFLDVGQGDGILIRSPAGNNFVIDGGSSSEMKCGEYTILSALKAQRMTSVDYWFISHTDADHISGLKEILQMGELSQVQIKSIVFSEYVVRDEALAELLALIADAGIPVFWMQGGDAIGDETSVFTCLQPVDHRYAEDKNAASLVLSYHSDAMDMLFTGDMDAKAVEDMLADNFPPNTGADGKREVDIEEVQRHYDCIKLPHHGSKYSYNEQLYMTAKYGVISCGYRNRYGHPHEEVLQGLMNAEVQILRIDEMGAVVFRSR